MGRRVRKEQREKGKREVKYGYELYSCVPSTEFTLYFIKVVDEFSEDGL